VAAVAIRVETAQVYSTTSHTSKERVGIVGQTQLFSLIEYLTAEITAHNTLFGFGLSKSVIRYLAEVDADLDTNWVVRAYLESDLEAMGVKKPGE
jgi:hypothetical protein